MLHNENSRVKIPALLHFTRLGYKYISLKNYEGAIDADTNIFVDVLCAAINRINNTALTVADVQKIVNDLKVMLENDDLGKEFYSVLINGYNGLKLIDFEDNQGVVNDYYVVTEMTCKNGSDEFLSGKKRSGSSGHGRRQAGSNPRQQRSQSGKNPPERRGKAAKRLGRTNQPLLQGG